MLRWRSDGKSKSKSKSDGNGRRQRQRQRQGQGQGQGQEQQQIQGFFALLRMTAVFVAAVALVAAVVWWRGGFGGAGHGGTAVWWRGGFGGAALMVAAAVLLLRRFWWLWLLKNRGVTWDHQSLAFYDNDLEYGAYYRDFVER